MQDAIANKFNITPWLFLVPLAVVVMIIKKVPAIPALLGGALLGGVFALIFQPDIVNEIAGGSELNIKDSYKGVMTSIFTEVSVQTGNENC